MIFITDKPGQLGNQLWAYSNMIGIARFYNQKIIIFLDKESLSMFDTSLFKIARDNSVYFWNSSNTGSRIIKKIIHVVIQKANSRASNKVTCLYCFLKPLQDYTFLKKRGKIYFINSWNQRTNYEKFIQNSDFIRSIISPSECIRSLVSNTFKDLRNKYKMIVAVHIRRGDYRTFCDGRYFFDDSVYISYMDSFSKLVKVEELLFYIFSNEDVSISSSSHRKVYFKNGKSSVADMWAMSNCDYIIAPPSTFSMWASFWKKTPLYILQRQGKKIALADFRPIIAQDIFEGNVAWWNMEV